ncbi:MAG: hypothetical protein M1837_007171 [Sclerophora amabilis]|nr:MAG: hypothetical protein M1837_007171 [Sclerophora amabilis]
MAWQWSVGAFGLFAILTAIRIVAKERGATWHKWVPGGIAVAVGMYNVPSFTLARTVGGLLHLYWVSYSSTSPLSTPFSWFSHKRRNKQPQDEHEREEGTTATATATATATEDNEGNRDETPVVVLASGLILGEGVVSIVNLTLASLKVAHL